MSTFVVLWVSHTAVVLTAIVVSAFLSWRAGHFTHQEEARYLALDDVDVPPSVLRDGVEREEA